jgi:hypothetical protein
VIAFIGIKGTDPSIYIARKAENFAPVRISVTSVRIDNSDWSDFLKPSVSPDGSTVFFMVSLFQRLMLFSHDLKTKKNVAIGSLVVDDCTIRSGVNAGSVLMLQRNFGEEPDGGFGYICYCNTPGHPSPGQRLGACSEFEPNFNKYGAACSQTPR